jgi:hypothetical protein
VFASRSLVEHLARGLLGFGALAAAFLVTTHGALVPIALAIVGIALLRGCPTCWMLGLMEILSAGKTKRICEGGSCRVVRAEPKE